MRIVCLANSYKLGGRCLGGIKLDTNNKPVYINGHAEWIRPVCSYTGHEEIPNEYTENIELLDIIEFKDLRRIPHDHQSENVEVDVSSINKIGCYECENLNLLTISTDDGRIFGNKGKAVPEDKIHSCNNSLLFIKVRHLIVKDGQPYKKDDKLYIKKQLHFNYNGISYDLTITDPMFLFAYENDNNILDDIEYCYVSLSLAPPYNNWLTKLVAGIIIPNKVLINYIDDIPIEDLPF